MTALLFITNIMEKAIFYDENTLNCVATNYPICLRVSYYFSASCYNKTLFYTIFMIPWFYGATTVTPRSIIYMSEICGHYPGKQTIRNHRHYIKNQNVKACQNSYVSMGLKKLSVWKEKEWHNIILKYNVLAKEVCVAMAITPSLLF